MEGISLEQIRRETQEFWDAFTHQAKERFQGLYSPTGSCFAIDGRRTEPARLMWVRREREFFGPKSSVKVKMGVLSVQILSPNLAVASYPFHFSIIRVMPNGSRVEVDLPWARATQVFRRKEDGKLEIIHEHLSSAEPIVARQLPAEAAAR